MSKIQQQNQAKCVIDALSHVAASSLAAPIVDEAKLVGATVLTTTSAVSEAREHAKTARVAASHALAALDRSLRALIAAAAADLQTTRDPLLRVEGPRTAALFRASPNRRVLLTRQFLPGLAAPSSSSPLLKQAVADTVAALARADGAQAAQTAEETSVAEARRVQGIALAAWAVTYERLGHVAALEWRDAPEVVLALRGRVDRRRTVGGRRRVDERTPAPPTPPVPLPAPMPAPIA